MRMLLAVAVLTLATAATAQAQTHPCDQVQPTSGTAAAGAAITFQACASPLDVNGNPVNPTGWALYDNGVRTTPTFVFGTQSPVSGLFLVTLAATAPATAGVHTYQVAEINAVSEGDKSAPFALTVTSPPGRPTAPVKLIVR